MTSSDETSVDLCPTRSPKCPNKNEPTLPCEKCDAERDERRQHLRRRGTVRKEHRTDDERGGGRVDVEVVELDCRADEARENHGDALWEPSPGLAADSEGETMMSSFVVVLMHCRAHRRAMAQRMDARSRRSVWRNVVEIQKGVKWPSNGLQMRGAQVVRRGRCGAAATLGRFRECAGWARREGRAGGPSGKGYRKL